MSDDGRRRNSSNAKNKYQALQKSAAEVCSSSNMLKLGQFVADMIRLRTKLGFGVKQEGQQKEKLAALKPSTIEARRHKNLRGDTTPGRSNLTETGQMLDSIKAINPTNGKVTVIPTGSRHGDGKSNEDIAQYATDGASGRVKRAFMNVSNVEHEKIKKEVEKIFRVIVKEKLIKTK
jgi:hypothetical protein